MSEFTDKFGYVSMFGEDGLVNKPEDKLSSSNETTYTYKVVWCKSGVDVYTLYEENLEKPIGQREIIIFYEDPTEGSNLFGTACRVVMGQKRKDLMYALQKGKTQIFVEGDFQSTNNLTSWCLRIADYSKDGDKKIDNDVLEKAISFELYPKPHGDTLISKIDIFKYINAKLAEWLYQGASALEEYKYKPINYEYDLYGDKMQPIIPILSLDKIGKDHINNISNNFLDIIIFQQAKKDKGYTRLGIPEMLEDVFLLYVKEFLSTTPFIKELFTLLQGFFDKIENSTKGFSDSFKENLAAFNAFLCGFINSIISFAQSIIAILAFALEKFPTFSTLSSLDPSDFNQTWELVEDIYDVLKEKFLSFIEKVHSFFANVFANIKSAVDAIISWEGFSTYFWFYLFGGLVFEIIAEVVTTFLTGGASAVAKSFYKVKRFAEIIQDNLKKGWSLAKRKIDNVRINLSQIRDALIKELNEFLEAVTSGTFLKYLRRKMLRLKPSPPPELFLHGLPIAFKSVKWRVIKYAVRDPQLCSQLRNVFDKRIQPEFIKYLVNNPKNIELLKKLGVDDEGITKMRSGRVPSRMYAIHHKIPLHDGGTNDFSNLIFIVNKPYHYALTNYQNKISKGLKHGDEIEIDWPSFDDEILME